MFCGDATQTDLIKQNERNGIVDFMRVLRLMSSIDIIEFGVEDIVRSGLVKEFILAKMELNLLILFIIIIWVILNYKKKKLTV